MIRFREKRYSSLIGNIVTGAGIGGSIGTLAARFAPKSVGKDPRNTYNSGDRFAKGAMIAGAGMLVGAALGALVTGIQELDKQHSRSNVDNRLFGDVIADLKKSGFTKGTDFTEDPKLASLMKMKVCIVVSKASGDLKMVINTVSDPKLKEITTSLVKNLPSMSVTNEKIGDRFNELNITALSSNNDSTFVSSIAERFIRQGYPVYLVEVG